MRRRSRSIASKVPRTSSSIVTIISIPSIATVRSSAFLRRITTSRGICADRRPSARHGARPRREPACLRRGHGRLRRQAGPDGIQGHRRDQPHMVSLQGRLAAVACRRSRRRSRTARSISATPPRATISSDWALDGFEGRGNGRLVCHDPGDREDADRSFQPGFSEWRLRLSRRTRGALGQHVAVPHLSLLDRGREGRHAGIAGRKPAGLSRQHQSRLRRHLLACPGRIAVAGL